jgi:hypothetical protein
MSYPKLIQSVSQSDVHYSLYDIIANKIHMQHYCGMQHYGSTYGHAQSTFSQEPGNQVISISTSIIS